MAMELTVEGLGGVDVRKEFRPTQQPPTMLRILDPDVRKAVGRLNQRYAYRIAKRLFDVLFSLLVIALFSWLFLLVAIAIKVDDPDVSSSSNSCVWEKTGGRSACGGFAPCTSTQKRGLPHSKPLTRRMNPSSRSRMIPVSQE